MPLKQCLRPIYLRACIVLLSEASSSSHVLFSTSCVSTDTWAQKRRFGLVQRSQTTKISKFLIMHETLVQPNLYHIDFLGHPAATKTCTDPISCTTNSAVQNELTNLEILMKNRPNRTYSFVGSWPAITPAEYYSSCACIVLLSEASSSSHVRCHCASARTPGPWRVHLASSNVPKPLKITIPHHARDLGIA